MNPDEIGRDEARSAVANVADQRAAVRAADLDRVGLLLLAAVNVAYGAVVVALAGRIAAPLLIVLPMIPMTAFAFWRERNERVFSRRGRPILLVSVAVSLIWFTMLNFWITPRIGWHPSTPDWHFAVVSALGTIPLLVGAWLIGRVR